MDRGASIRTTSSTSRKSTLPYSRADGLSTSNTGSSARTVHGSGCTTGLCARTNWMADMFADGMFSDVTERRRTEEALAQSERRYRLLFERNLAGVFRALPDDRLLDCNEALLRILGYETAAELKAVPASEIFYDPEERRATFERLYRERSLTGHDVRLKRRDGTPVWVMENVSLVEDDKGHPTFIEGTLFDITARKLAEQAVSRERREIPHAGNQHPGRGVDG